ncbi:MAG: hypothetical protein ACOX0H_00160 [Patescibacteria group bacterium]
MSTKGNRDFRPEYHYTPKTGWINDPNGLTYENGTWHLFAQHYPHDTIWEPHALDSCPQHRPAHLGASRVCHSLPII